MRRLSAPHPSPPSAESRSRWPTLHLKPAISSRPYPVVATENLRLRGFVLGDIPRLLTIAQGRGAGDTAIYVPEHFTGLHAKQWITSHPSSWDLRHEVHWAITLLSDDQLVGYCGLTDVSPDNSRATFGFWLDRRTSSGKSCAAEATQAALAFAFNDLAIHSVYAFHFAEDLLAAQILATTGLQRGEVLKSHVLHLGKFEDVIPWHMPRSAWLESLVK